MRGRTVRNGVQPHSVQDMRALSAGAPPTLSADGRRREWNPCWPLDYLEMPSARPLAKWALTKYAATGCPRGSIRKASRRTNKQKQNAKACGTQNATGSQTAAGKTGTGWHCPTLASVGLGRRRQRAGSEASSSACY